MAHLLENLKVFIERDGWDNVEAFLKNRLAEVHNELETCGLDNISGFVHLLEQRGRAKEIKSLLNLKTRLRKRQSKEKENA